MMLIMQKVIYNYHDNNDISNDNNNDIIFGVYTFLCQMPIFKIIMEK